MSGNPTDYSVLYAAMDALMDSARPQMELHREIGLLISNRPEKGAAVAAAEYLHSRYPNTPGFSPRNLRRMRDFYRTYKDAPEAMAEAMTIGWTQNVVILEAELTLQEKAWYIRAVQRFKWSKLKLAERIASSFHLEAVLDSMEEMCHAAKNTVEDQQLGPSSITPRAGRDSRERLPKRDKAEMTGKKQDLPLVCEKKVLPLPGKSKMERQQRRIHDEQQEQAPFALARSFLDKKSIKLGLIIQRTQDGIYPRCKQKRCEKGLTPLLHRSHHFHQTGERRQVQQLAEHMRRDVEKWYRQPP